jgi:hypothetical protein
VKYCGGCGRPLQALSCRHCGTGNPLTSKFCHECGRALAGEAPTAGADRTVVASLDDAEEVKDSAFWESYADRTGIPAAGLIEVAPAAMRESTVEVEDRDPRRRFRGGRERERGLYATLQEERERRRPIRILVAASTILAVVLILAFLSTRSWHGVLGPLRPEVKVAPSDQPTVASSPVPDPIPAPAEPAPPAASPAAESPAPAEEIRAPSPAARSDAPEVPAEPRPSPTMPPTSAERMAAFLVGRDGPERALETALAVSTFYRPNSEDFTYWRRVVAAIRASTARKDAPGEAVSR